MILLYNKLLYLNYIYAQLQIKIEYFLILLYLPSPPPL